MLFPHQVDSVMYESPQYDLYAVINHHGSYISGHYDAVIKDERGNLYRFNDCTVTKVRFWYLEYFTTGGLLEMTIVEKTVHCMYIVFESFLSPDLLFYQVVFPLYSPKDCKRSSMDRCLVIFLHYKSQNIPYIHSLKE